MAIDKIQAESINLADTFAFTGTVSGTPSDWVKISTTTVDTNVSSVDFETLSTDYNNFIVKIGGVMPSNNAYTHVIISSVIFQMLILKLLKRWFWKTIRKKE